MEALTTWHKLIADCLKDNNETWEDVVANTLSEDQLHVKFYAGYGSSNGEEFTMWTKNRVYFPVVYDGAEWVGSAPRNPCAERTGHQGGQ